MNKHLRACLFVALCALIFVSSPAAAEGPVPATAVPDAAGQTAVVDHYDQVYAGSYDVIFGEFYDVPAGGDAFNLLVVGDQGRGTVTHSVGTLTLRSGGGDLQLGLHASNSNCTGIRGQGTYDFSGGIIDLVNATIGISGTGTFTQTGGTFSATGFVRLAQNCSTGTFTFSGGTLLTPTLSGGGGNSTFNFDGGLLQARAATTTFVSGLTAANVQDGGAKIDSKGFNVTIPQVLQHDAGLGATADGGLLKQGAGTLTLSATNIYTGATTVSGGSLAVSGRLANTSGIVLNNGGTLALSGSTSVTDRIVDSSTMTIKGGAAFATGGFDEGTAPNAPGGAGGAAGMGALAFSTTTSSVRATIDFANTATGSTLVFSSLDSASKLAFVKVLNWTGTPGSDAGSSTNDRLLFQTNPGFTAADLANVQFSNDSGVNYAAGAVLINYNGYYELVPPVPNQPPAITSANTTTFTKGTAGTFTVTATGYPTPTINLTNGLLPSGVNYAAGMGNLAGTPTVFGTFALTFTASNGVGSNAVQSFSLVVNPTAQEVKSGPKITRNAGGGFTVGFIGNPGQQYTVQYVDFLPATSAQWNFLSFQTAGGNGAFSITIPAPGSGVPKRFYRAIVP